MDQVTLARTARESLARGLGALQTPGVPTELHRAAEPMAHAMSALHRVEQTRGAAGAEAAPSALGALRQALAQLQSTQMRHPAVDQAMEAIAAALGAVHQLTALVGQASVGPSPPTKPSSQYEYQPQQAPPQVAVVGQPQPGQAVPRPANPVAATQLAPQWGQPAAPPAPQAYPQHAAPQQPAAWQQPAPAAPQQAYQPPAAAPYQQPPAAPAAQGAPGGQGARIDAELGAHSATNFYKGLSGNDVIDSGGIFIATYTIPEVGQQLLIKVSMPGGYEFEALGVVRWTRDAPMSGTDSPPGFGAQFTQISPEARQLVYRYVRNREPLFHDDL